MTVRAQPVENGTSKADKRIGVLRKPIFKSWTNSKKEQVVHRIEELNSSLKNLDSYRRLAGDLVNLFEMARQNELESQTVMNESFNKLQEKQALLEEDISIIQREFHKRESALVEKERRLTELNQKIRSIEAEDNLASPKGLGFSSQLAALLKSRDTSISKILMLMTVWSIALYLLFSMLAAIYAADLVGIY
ncbi:hypothetical protein K7432_000724 [Basidiobolus ranarum]|uniref:Uncharacterized protein n=1 Tax=Basidiobolus ranarum TaxID=34480 RepID=A0ABR2WAS8_9FUNG